MSTDFDFSFLIELVAFVAIVVGIAFIYFPAALIVGGVIAIAAVELQPNETSEDA